MSETHTPGPWTWFDYPDGRKLLCAHNRAVVHCPDAPMSVMPDDANLIAAAPDLLAALKQAIRTIRTWHGMGMGAREAQAWALYQASPEMKAIDAAIAKAEGRS